ncbi:hypothetical protein ACFV1C_18365 [Streptomyces sp. NPDC059605]|uniref:hypothetical protein n=1 Tax=unclassified Streptomyces TaxID=2593676 RepID=UPI00368FD95C
MTLRTAFAHDLDALGPAAGLLHDESLGLLSSAPWLRAHQALDSAESGYLGVTDGIRPVGAGRIAFPDHEPVIGYQPHSSFPFRAEHPYALLGPRRGYRAQLPLTAPGSAAALLGAATEQAARHRRRWLYALHLTTPTADAISRDRAAMPILAPGFDVVVHLRGRSVREHLDSIGKNGRRRSQDRNRVAAMGLLFDRERLADCIEEVVPLRQQAFRRHGSNRTTADLRRELELMGEHLAPYETLFTAREPLGRRLVGYCLVYSWGGRLWNRSVGVVEELRTTRTPLLFELQFYQPLELCFELGLPAYQVGPSNYEAKLRRGGVVQPLWQVGLLDGTEVFPPDGVARWTDHVLGGLSAECGHRLSADFLAGVRRQALDYARAHFGDDRAEHHAWHGGDTPAGRPGPEAER